MVTQQVCQGGKQIILLLIIIDKTIPHSFISHKSYFLSLSGSEGHILGYSRNAVNLKNGGIGTFLTAVVGQVKSNSD